jgi:signal transduction histidine kinase
MHLSAKEKSAFYGDRKRIMQLLVILVDNALHYTERGEITVALGAREREITLTVADTGRGIGLKHLDKIFDRFYRVTDTRGMHQDGSGLGLSIAKWIVAEHGGTIRAESTLGRGTVFTVILPTRMA